MPSFASNTLTEKPQNRISLYISMEASNICQAVRLIYSAVISTFLINVIDDTLCHENECIGSSLVRINFKYCYVLIEPDLLVITGNFPLTLSV